MSNSVDFMLDEIAQALKSGDQEVLAWLRDQLEQTGASEVAVDLATGLIARLMPDAGSAGRSTLQVGDQRRLH